jgi:ribosomal protein S18 acetylase RimI-like enzyme
VLLREVERKATEIGIKKILLHTGTQNFHARKLFTQSGYITSEIKKGFYPEGQDAIVMYKDSLENLLK